MLDDYPRGPGSDLLNQLMSDSVALFADHPVNVAPARSRAQLPATNIWLWGQGRTPALPPFAEVYGKRGAMITAVDLLRGLAALIGWERIEVPGATGYLDTDYAAKGRAAIDALGRHRHHLRPRRGAPTKPRTKATRRPRSRRSRKSTGTSSARCTRPWQRTATIGILITPDHPTPLRTKTHSHGAVPFALAGTGSRARSISNL